MLSIVVPIFNEKESLPSFYKELIKELKNIKQEYEIIFIDDGSTDTSLDILKELQKKDKTIKVFSFRKNEGKAEALSLGFAKAKGDIIVTLDADLQDSPSDIRKMIVELGKGWDVVCGWRKNRKDPVKKLISSKIFNYLAGIFWGLKLHDYNCGLKAYTRESAQSLHLYGGMHRFIPLLAHDNGFLVTEVPVNHEVRKYGKSKYGFSKLWKDLPDMFTMLFLTKYSKRPLHFFGLVGGIVFLVGILILSYLSILHFQNIAIGRRPLLTFGMLLVLSGFQIFFTGFLADLIINISQKDKKEFSIKFESK